VALKNFIKVKRSGEDEIEQKEPLLHKLDLLKTSGCAGNKQRAVSPSWSHINATGIKFKNVCATEAASMIEATRTSMVVSEWTTRAFKRCSFANIAGDMARRIKATLFGWKTGTSPVIVPNNTPSIEKATSKSKSNGENASIIF